MIDSSSNDNGLHKYYPLLVGLAIYVVFLPLMPSKSGEGAFQIFFLVVHLLGGCLAGKQGGTDGIIGIMFFTAIVVIGYCLLRFIKPDSLWIIGPLFLGFTQALFWGGWLLGLLLYDGKS